MVLEGAFFRFHAYGSESIINHFNCYQPTSSGAPIVLPHPVAGFWLEVEFTQINKLTFLAER